MVPEKRIKTPVTSTVVKTLMLFETIVFAGAIAYFAGLNIVHFLSHQPHLNFHYDFGFFYWAFDAVWSHHSSFLLYNQALEQNWMASLGYPIYDANEYVYPPQFAVLFSWLAVFPYRVASELWFVMALFGYGLSIWLLAQLGFPKKSLIPCLFLIGTCLANDGFYSDVTIGNVTWLLFTLFSVAFYLKYEKDWGIFSGILIGIASVIKITPVFLVFYYLLKRDWKVVIGAVLGITVTTLMTMCVVGWRIVWDFAFGFSRLFNTTLKNGPAPHNISMKGVLLWIQESTHWSQHFLSDIFMLILVFLIGFIAWLVFTNRIVDRRQDMALAMLCLIWFSPLVEGTHLLVLVITLVMTFSMWWDKHGGKSVSGGHLLWFLLFGTSSFLLSTIREVLEGSHHSFPLLFIGYSLLSVGAFVQLVPRPQTKRISVPSQSALDV